MSILALATHFSTHSAGVTYYKDLNTSKPMFAHLNNSNEWRSTTTEIYEHNKISAIVNPPLFPVDKNWDGHGVPSIGSKLEINNDGTTEVITIIGCIDGDIIYRCENESLIQAIPISVFLIEDEFQPIDDAPERLMTMLSTLPDKYKVEYTNVVLATISAMLVHLTEYADSEEDE